MMKKIALLVLTAVLIIGCMTGCEKKVTTWTLDVDGELVPVDTLFTVDGVEVSLFEYRFYLATKKADLDGGDDSYWLSNEDAREELYEVVMNSIRYDIAKAELVKQLGVGLTWKERSEINKTVKKYKASFTDDEWAQLMAGSYVDDVLYQKYNYYSMYTGKLEEHYFGEESGNTLKVKDILAYMQEDYYHYKYIYVKFDYDNTQTNKNIIETAQKELDSGASFEDVMKKYSRDYNETYAKTGYFIRKDAIHSSVDTVKDLEIDEVSGIVEEDNGYFIYKRYDITQSDAQQNIATFKSQYMTEYIDVEIMKIMDSQEVKAVSEYFNDRLTMEAVLHD